MAASRLTRVAALEDRAGRYTPGAWIEGLDGETRDEAIARYENEHAPLDANALHIVWISAEPEQRPCVN